MKEDLMVKAFPIMSVCREDILMEFDESDNFEEIKKRVLNMDDAEMLDLAMKLADDYTGQLFWNSLQTIFEEKFMKG